MRMSPGLLEQRPHFIPARQALKLSVNVTSRPTVLRLKSGHAPPSVERLAGAPAPVASE
jgi:hypothetical protein